MYIKGVVPCKHMNQRKEPACCCCGVSVGLAIFYILKLIWNVYTLVDSAQRVDVTNMVIGVISSVIVIIFSVVGLLSHKKQHVKLAKAALWLWLVSCLFGFILSIVDIVTYENAIEYESTQPSYNAQDAVAISNSKTAEKDSMIIAGVIVIVISVFINSFIAYHMLAYKRWLETLEINK
jgi:cytochrome bd-type quinol oxidase subunit 2